MKKVMLSAAAVLAMSSLAVAGGDIAPVEEPVVVPVVVKDYSGAYIGIAYTYTTAPVSNFNTYMAGDWLLNSVDFDLDTSGVTIDAGYRLNAFIAFEGRYTFGGTGSADIPNGLHGTVGSGTIDSDISSWGIYAKPMYPISDVFDVYALIGYGGGTFDNTTTFATRTGISTVDTSIDIDGFSWGLGLSYAFTENISVFADYVSVADEDIANPSDLPAGITDTKYKIETFNIGINYKF